MHLLLAAGFKLYFFHLPDRTSNIDEITTAASKTVAAVTAKAVTAAVQIANSSSSKI